MINENVSLQQMANLQKDENIGQSPDRYANEQPIYPNFNSLDVKNIPTFKDYPNVVQDPELSKSRIIEIKNIISQWEKDKLHYSKLKKKWSKFDSIIRYTGIILGVSATTATTIITAGAFLPLQTSIIVISALSGVTMAKLGFFDILSLELANKKKSKYNDRVQLIDNYINKLWILFEKIRNDHNIELEELEQIRNLKDEYNALLYEGSTIKFSSEQNKMENNSLENNRISKKDIKKIEKIVQKQLKQEIINKKIEDRKDRLKSNGFL